MSPQKTSRVRYFILALVCLITVINYADRSTLSITGSAISKEMGLTPIQMGYIFSAFGWAYVIGQLPGGWLLDRFGSKMVYGCSILLWSLATFVQGFTSSLSVAALVIALFVLRFILGLVEAPAFPANGRIVASWFPTAERGRATALYQSCQYVAVVLFAPLMGWITHTFAWNYVFFLMGSIGIGLAFLWFSKMSAPRQHPHVSPAELEHMIQGGALVDMDERREDETIDKTSTWSLIKQLLGSRMLIGIYIGQYCITALSYFFITWFPMYLVQGRGMNIMDVGFVATLPAICGFLGGITGGTCSDLLLKRGVSLTWARKTPYIIGMVLATSLIFCNFTDSIVMVIAIMALAFFGKGLAAVGWATIGDTSPKELIGLSGGLCNGLGNIAGIVTPIVIGYILAYTGSFNGALYFVGFHSLLAAFTYLFIVGDIRRITLKQRAMEPQSLPEESLSPKHASPLA